ncbi:TetR/AcrR family transcriptional regulator [Asanoa siamensis]|uniref:TetR family transcriptional regulator n=1 Tax=Asanoa siamensis TaxID=926357 RepID=A0ABQ4CLD3_9ACTN|nr:TetR/AcrR family transcriptional regulator [Asanoa siamensis]GIF72107.1 TetR family transcriptional regulator [Asanoa siamensis]
MVRAARSYHHGDLRAALVEAGLKLARTGGIGALGVRELTRSVGVTPNAAYRHFADREALVLAIAVEAQDRLAQTMLDRMKAIRADADPADRALARLRAVGEGYVHFAMAEPGWFELAILTRDEPGDDSPQPTIESRVAPPYQLLVDALDGLVEAGVLTPAQRPNAEVACWSTVHGFADLATRGPLRAQDPPILDALATYVVDTIIAGVAAPPR